MVSRSRRFTANTTRYRYLLCGVGSLRRTKFAKRPTARENERRLDRVGGLEIASLAELAAAEAKCKRCTLYRDATQVVPGEGQKYARIMIVGEQPGDQEDLAGRPFVGPAGRILDRALADAGIDRRDCFVTNAVKHFKHEQRGKRRLHKRPNVYEIARCKWWLDLERTLVKPKVIVILGASAARSVLGKVGAISRLRGAPIATSNREQALVTLHPSALLRIRDDTERHRAYREFVDDLREVSRLLKG
jgi:uracil-DNA glycosylase